MKPLSRDEIRYILDRTKAGDLITITRSNGGDLYSTVSGPALVSGTDPAVGIDLLDGEPHVIRRSSGEWFGTIVQLEVVGR